MQDPIDPVKLDRLAQVAVKVGLNLQPGQDLVMTAPVSALPLVRRIAEHAYKAGAGLVTPILSDDAVTLARYRHARDESFDAAAGWLYDGMAAAYDKGAARLAIAGGDPMLLSGEDPDKVGRANRAMSMAYSGARDRITRFATNWTIVAWPDAAWARLVSPDLSEHDAQRKLAEAIFAASRVDDDDAVARWEAHNEELGRRAAWLDGQNFASLHFTGPGTDLSVGLADGHKWVAGATETLSGILCNPNIPTEEVFTTPHKLRVSGHVSATKPLSHQGTLIEEIRVRFEDGRIVEAHASKGEGVLQKVLDTDEGARRLGEVALVPHASPISQSGMLFYNTLFDENAASHIALGQCYSTCFQGGETMDNDEVARRGGNSSAIHIDWMIGSDRIDIDGLSQSGERVPVMRKGAWV
ncbi:aminopeptidase [Pararhodobacter aggregans]|uniref:Aminopeptidase n=1 Tax=Pararhodobacter aggregans TaxID=404875 RepID=A0A2T7UV76_9RHOB|nr:aminopeptidase [Pararhodobacter aggregans]PTX03840.1 aminopeptidase T [Pararhodobacter aggregans]PVE48680.1 aminopeptidase [Pararhodobacter aggregans]